MSHYQIVCGSCGYRIHSDLLAKSLECNKNLADAIALVCMTHQHPGLEYALEQIPNEVKEAIYPKLGERYD